MGVLSVMCDYNLITQVRESSKTSKAPTVKLCWRVSYNACVNVHERFQTRAQSCKLRFSPCQDVIWCSGGVNVSHGATLRQAHRASDKDGQGSGNCVNQFKELF